MLTDAHHLFLFKMNLTLIDILLGVAEVKFYRHEKK
jgi:hypothetical protein